MLSADYSIFLVSDYENSVSYITDTTLEEYALSSEEAYKLAAENLTTYITKNPVQVQEQDGIYMLIMDGFHEASLLLTDEIWASLAELFEAAPVAIAVTKDVLVVTDSNNQQITNIMINHLKSEFKDSHDLLSLTPLIRKKDGWVKYKQ